MYPFWEGGLSPHSKCIIPNGGVGDLFKGENKMTNTMY